MRSDFRIVVSCWFGLVLHISACNVPGGPQMAYSATIAQEKMSELGTRLPMGTIEKGYRSGVRESLQLVIRNQDEWKAFWKRHSSIDTNPPPAPIINFNREMVVGIFLGEKSTGGYQAEFVQAERRDSSLYFYYREKAPPPGAMVTQALTQPFHLVRVAKYDNPQIIFRRDS
jgi:protease stability complex PrcB-like protein